MKEILTVIANHYGLQAQLKQLSSECAELIKAALDLDRKDEKGNNFTALYEEIADVEIMTAQIKILLNCENRVEEVKESKLGRQLNRMGVR